MPNRPRGAVLGAWLLLTLPALAAAQPSDVMSGHAGQRRLTVGGEMAAVISPADDSAWFNYTSYDANALRMARLRLFGEWHAADRLSVVAELRAENPAALSVPALYVRWQPVASRALYIQAGRIPPLVGAFSRRAYGRDNAVIGLPLAYQYLTSLRADALPLTVSDLLRMRARGWQPSYPLGSDATGPGVPLVAVSEWDTGVQGTWQSAHVELSTAVTRGSPAVPVVRETNGGLMWSGRATMHLPVGASAGVSAARGQWVRDAVLTLTPNGTSSASTQSVFGADLEFGHGPLLVRSEWLHTRFTLPLATSAPAGVSLSAWSGFVEVRYRPHPRWQFGTRLERLGFSKVLSEAPGAVATTWDAGVDRIEATLGFRATRAFEVRGGWQQNWRSGGRVRERGFPALALLYWF